MKKVIGLGGVFFKSEDPAALRAWYREHLGIASEDWGAVFLPAEVIAAVPNAQNLWSPFPASTAYLEPSSKDFMFNFIVADLHALLDNLRSEGVNVMDKTDESEFGKFGWVIDPKGNKVELWEPPR